VSLTRLRALRYECPRREQRNAMVDPAITNESADSVLSPIPLILGVTGHRDLVPEDVPALENLVRRELEQLKSVYPHTPFVLLSPLAEGADQLVARVALGLGMQLVVPLPMEKELYVEDFATPESRHEFEDLLGQAEAWYEMPVPPGVTRDQVRQPGPVRDRQYESVGIHIARRSQILLAIMEEMNRPEMRVGGTYHTVMHRLGIIPEYAVSADSPSVTSNVVYVDVSGRGPLPDSPLDMPETGPVYHILARRMKNPGGFSPYHPRCYRIYPKDPESKHPEESGAFSALYAKIEQYNEDLTKARLVDSREVAEGAIELLPGSLASTLPSCLARLRSAHAGASALANSYQRTVTRMLRLLVMLGYAAFACFTIFIYCIWESPYLLLMYPLLLGIAFLCWPPDRIRKWFYPLYRHCHWLEAHNKYLDCRALAEAVRIQFYWGLAGLKDSAADHYLRKHRGEIEWSRQALQNLQVLVDVNGARCLESSFHERATLVQERWIRSQSKWLTHKVATQGQRLARAEAWAHFLIGTGIVTAAILGITLLLRPGFRELAIPGTEILAMDTLHAGLELAAIAGLFWLHYLERLFSSEQVKQYQRMKELFARADRHLGLCLARDQDLAAENILRELGKEALGENADWLMLHRERPPEVET